MELTVSTVRAPTTHRTQTSPDKTAAPKRSNAAANRGNAGPARSTHGSHVANLTNNNAARLRASTPTNTMARSDTTASARINAAAADSTPIDNVHEPKHRAKTDREAEAERPSNNAAHQLRNKAGSFVHRHPRAAAYGTAGLVAAALILIIGFWPTLLIALLVGIGATIGTYRDGDTTLRRFATRAARRLKS